MARTARSTAIRISKETRDALKELGSGAETYKGILKRLVAEAWFNVFYEKQQRILETDDFVPLDEI